MPLDKRNDAHYTNTMPFTLADLGKPPFSNPPSPEGGSAVSPPPKGKSATQGLTDATVRYLKLIEDASLYLVDDTWQAATAIVAAEEYWREIQESAVGQSNKKQFFSKEILHHLEQADDSQKKFWHFYKFLQEVADSPAVIDASDFELLQYAILGGGRRLSYLGESFSLSAKGRGVALGFLRSIIVDQSENDLTIADLFALFSSKVRKLGKLRNATSVLKDSEHVPSTHSWVHGFALWTGISPPVLVSLFASLEASFANIEVLGEVRVYNFGSGAGRYRGWPFDRRPAKDFGAGHFQPRSSAARGAQRRRYRSVRSMHHASGRSTGRAGGRQMGDQFPLPSRSRAR